MSESDQFVSIERRGGCLVAVMARSYATPWADDQIFLDLKSAQDRLTNLKRGGYPHDQTKLAVNALLAARGGGHE